MAHGLSFSPLLFGRVERQHIIAKVHIRAKSFTSWSRSKTIKQREHGITVSFKGMHLVT